MKISANIKNPSIGKFILFTKLGDKYLIVEERDQFYNEIDVWMLYQISEPYSKYGRDNFFINKTKLLIHIKLKEAVILSI